MHMKKIKPLLFSLISYYIVLLVIGVYAANKQCFPNAPFGDPGWVNCDSIISKILEGAIIIPIIFSIKYWYILLALIIISILIPHLFRRQTEQDTKLK